MKNLSVIFFVLVFAVTACLQQGGGTQQEENVQQREGTQQRGGQSLGTAEERAKAQTERMGNLVELTEDQKAKIETIEVELQKQMDARRQNSQGNMEAMRTAMQEIETTREAKYKEVLTDDQLRKYTEDRNQRSRQRGGQRQGGGQGQGGRQRPN